MSIDEVTQIIIKGKFDNDQLNSIVMAVKFAKSQLARRNKNDLTIGTRVRFLSTKSGKILTGTVQKIAIKNITVATPSGLWTVPANMLEAT